MSEWRIEYLANFTAIHMLSKKHAKIWRELQYKVSDIKNESSLKDVFHVLVEWYERNNHLLSSRSIESYRIKDLININPDLYPIHKSEATPRSFKNLQHIQPSTEDSIVMLFRDVLWEIIVLNIDIQCPRCQYELGLSALFDIEFKKVLLECIQCGWIQTTDGQSFEPSNKLCVANNLQLSDAGLLPSSA